MCLPPEHRLSTKVVSGRAGLVLKLCSLVQAALLGHRCRGSPHHLANGLLQIGHKEVPVLDDRLVSGNIPVQPLDHFHHQRREPILVACSQTISDTRTPCFPHTYKGRQPVIRQWFTVFSKRKEYILEGCRCCDAIEIALHVCNLQLAG